MINPDRTGLGQFAGQSVLFYDGEDASHAYGGAFAPNGTFFANYFPMKNMTEAAGFGGIRRYQRGARGYTPVLGVTRELIPEYVSSDPVSYGVFAPPYAAEPCALPDGRLVVSWTAEVGQDYGLHLVNADGSKRSFSLTQLGPPNCEPECLAPAPLPPIITDRVKRLAPMLPPAAAGPHDRGGTFVFDCLNVYFTAPVDSEIISAMPLGAAGTIRFFIDHQRRRPGSFERIDWRVLLREIGVREATNRAPGGRFEKSASSPRSVTGSSCTRSAIRRSWNGCWDDCNCDRQHEPPRASFASCRAIRTARISKRSRHGATGWNTPCAGSPPNGVW